MEITVQKGELWVSVTATAEEIEECVYIRGVINRLIGGPDPVMTITGLPKAESEEVEKAVVKANAKARRDAIDYGKVRALWDAKWNVAKIADEIGCSEQSIRNYLKKEGIIN